MSPGLLSIAVKWVSGQKHRINRFNYKQAINTKGKYSLGEGKTRQCTINPAINATDASCTIIVRQQMVSKFKVVGAQSFP